MISRLKHLALSLFVFLGVTSNVSASESESIRERVENGALLIDVRTQQEYDSGHLGNAINIPHPLIVDNLAQKGLPLDTEIIVYCKSGRRSEVAKSMLMQAGYSKVINAGGYQQLLAEQKKL